MLGWQHWPNVPPAPPATDRQPTAGPAASQVHHPHVVGLREVMSSRDKIYMVMELVTGGELFDKARSIQKRRAALFTKAWAATAF